MQFADYDSTEKTVYYLDFDTNELKSYKTTDGKEQILGELNAYVTTLKWSPNHKNVLVIMENNQGNAINNPFYQENVEVGANVTGHYDIGQRQFKLLNQYIDSFDWLTNDKIIYHYNDPKNKNISIANPDGSNWKELTSFSQTATIVRSGNMALVAGENSTVTRYDATGKKLETLSLPNSLKGTVLTGSTFTGDGRNGIIGTIEDNVLIVTRLKPGAVEELTRLPAPEGDFQLLWDNKTNDVYVASYDGLIKIATSHP